MFLIRILSLGLPDPDPLVRGMDPDPSIIKQIGRKTLIVQFCYFLMPFDLLRIM
jgi:hypothetical protein